MSSIDTNRFREALLTERKRIAAALENLKNENPGSVEDEIEQFRKLNHLAVGTFHQTGRLHQARAGHGPEHGDSGGTPPELSRILRGR